MTARKDKIAYYLDIARAVSERSVCLRRQYGAIIVRSDEIIATGYNGPPRGRRNCGELGCYRDTKNIPQGERYELCRAVHAEQNAIISAARRDCIGATMYIYGSSCGEAIDTSPCIMCRRFLINAGLARVICNTSRGEAVVTDVKDYVDEEDLP